MLLSKQPSTVTILGFQFGLYHVVAQLSFLRSVSLTSLFVIILQKLGWQRHTALVYRVNLWYWTSMLLSIDNCQNKVSADQYHVTISRAQVYSSSRSHVFVKLTADQVLVFRLDRGLMSNYLSKTGQDCSEAGFRIKSLPNYNFFFYINVFCCFVLCIWWLLELKTEGQTIYRKHNHTVTKLNSKFYLFLG